MTLVGLVDVNRAAAEAMADKKGLPREVVFDSLAQAIERAKPDAVFDVTVPAAHEGVTVEALRAGCHVLGEKPLSDALDKAQRMVSTAKQASRIYAVIQNRRYEPNIQRVRKVIESGAIGDIEELHADFFIGAHFGGFRDEMDFPLILDMAIHTYDAARYISGADPVSVYAHSFNPKRSWYKGDASAIVVFEMTNDVVFSYRGSWCAEGLHTSWNSDWRAVCRKGTLKWNGEAEIKAMAVKEGGKHAFHSEMAEVAIPEVTVEHQGHAGLIREFVECVRIGRRPQTHCEDNIKSLAMVLAAVESARSGKKVPVKW
jgi:predicted dehydrogenase